MMLRRNDRNLENIPVGALGLIALDGCTEMGAKVNDYLVKWRKEDGHIHKNDVAFIGYEKDTYLIDAKVPRFGSGEAKGIINESVRGKDLYLMVDVCNYSLTYSLTGNVNHMSPDDHFQNLKRIIAAVGGKVKVTLFGEKIPVNIPKHSTENTIITIDNKGYISEDKTRGNLIVKLKIKMPSDISEREEKLYEQLLKIESKKNNK